MAHGRSVWETLGVAYVQQLAAAADMMMMMLTNLPENLIRIFTILVVLLDL